MGRGLVQHLRDIGHPPFGHIALNAVLELPRLKPCDSCKTTALWTDRGYGDKWGRDDPEDCFRAGLAPLRGLSVDRKRIVKHGIRRLKNHNGFDEFGDRLQSQCWGTAEIVFG